ncbi:hypothetical protein BL250_01395 [Erwinia sp. OLTSP20]|uniref:DUF2594 family protein n=1 Tax=unclassified Erwinia TaxID=2622719 RepID=UPI000C1A8835|nr:MULTISPECIES: DUF2594 family protein [unclassified Erwinia]PIJ51378.1 hypothetical protein BV501_04935 [Erwinia sp. OAMSP11]PIJ74162.1 hypothetical protein BK416_05220 [Erwinia sp. OLSSP12]PIJ81548.1 hypothetical protein BLD47_08425 [Erwinia sp. OLCASP19]PIJ86125.1 hypothetical protein BLD46_05015 [Erwinia sp. OLMTSP26]PIJ87873.1 hypothetical protein BLD49_05015 [Erwinia sp. OLMDSP33]
MIHHDFSTQQDVQALANEVAGMKALVTLILKGMGQADAGKVIINMERYINTLSDPAQAEVLSTTVQQIKQAYRQ